MNNHILKIAVIILLTQNSIYAQNRASHDSIFMHCNIPETWIEGKTMPFDWKTNAKHAILQIEGEKILHIVDYSNDKHSDSLPINLQKYFENGETIQWKMFAFDQKPNNDLFSNGITLQRNKETVVCNGTINIVPNHNSAYINANVPSEYSQNDNITIKWQTNCKYVILQLESDRITHFCIYAENENSAILPSALWKYLDREPLKWKLIGINSDNLSDSIKDMPGKSSDILSVIVGKYDVVKSGFINIKTK